MSSIARVGLRVNPAVVKNTLGTLKRFMGSQKESPGIDSRNDKLSSEKISEYMSKCSPPEDRRILDIYERLGKDDIYLPEIRQAINAHDFIKSFGERLDINDEFALEKVNKQNPSSPIPLENIERLDIRDKVTGETVGAIDLDNERIIFYCRYQLEEEKLIELINYASTSIFNNPPTSSGGSGKVTQENLGQGFSEEEIGSNITFVTYIMCYG